MMRWLAFLFLGLSPAAAFVPPPVQVMDVPDNATLQATATTAFPQGVYRSDFAAGNGAPPLFYRPSGSACSAADNGAQVASADGKCWLAVFAAAGADVREWGVVADNSTNNTTTFQAAVTWGLANKGRLLLPTGTIFANTFPTGTLVTGGSFTLQGAGQDLSFLRGSGTGMAFSKVSADFTSSFHFRDFSCVTAQVNANTCLTLTQSGNVPNPAITALSDVTNVAFRGADNYAETQCWATGFSTNYVSNINFTNDVFVGCGGSVSAPVGVSLGPGGGTTSTIGVAYNFYGCSFLGEGTGMVYRADIQGVAIANSNFTGNGTGIDVVSAALVAGLSVVNSQFANINWDILDQGGVAPANYSNNLFYTTTATGIALQTVANLVTITGNTFVGNVAGSTGIAIPTVSLGGVITGNAFDNFATGIQITAGTGVLRVAGNMFTNTTKNVVSTDPQAIIGDGPVPAAIVPVSGAVNSGGLVQLTVSSTANFVTGQWVLVSGVGGLPAIASAATTPITVNDATHMTLQNVSFSGAYTSGGLVFSMQ